MKIECDVLIVGAGVIGLAIADKLSREFNVIVVEKNSKFGQETSSRNSEVVHSGIYYPQESLKTTHCIRGRKQLYEFCERYEVPFRKCGKFVVAVSVEETKYLDRLTAHCKQLDVPCEWRNQKELLLAETLVRAEAGLYLPETGIVDSHVLMGTLERLSHANGATLAYNHAITHLEKTPSGWLCRIEGPDGSFDTLSPFVINAAGLSAAQISNQVLGINEYEHRFCRGRYFTLSSSYRGRFGHLIYPVPPKDGLGVHVTIDLEGQARLGPDVDWVSQKDALLYECDWEALRPSFLAAAQRYCPSLRPGDLSPGLIGVRPKLFVQGKAKPDFLVEQHGGFIHLLGIESPGLTSCLSIAEDVKKMVCL